MSLVFDRNGKKSPTKGRASLFIIGTTPLDRCETELASGTSLGVKGNQLCLTKWLQDLMR